jgi:hypothetical protein
MLIRNEELHFRRDWAMEATQVDHDFVVDLGRVCSTILTEAGVHGAQSGVTAASSQTRRDLLVEGPPRGINLVALSVSENGPRTDLITGSHTQPSTIASGFASGRPRFGEDIQRVSRIIERTSKSTGGKGTPSART